MAARLCQQDVAREALARMSEAERMALAGAVLLAVGNPALGPALTLVARNIDAHGHRLTRVVFEQECG